MKWISNNDPPIYVWTCDEWYNQKNQKTYSPYLIEKCWKCEEEKVYFTKKTKVMNDSN